jgi:hypothetical protein
MPREHVFCGVKKLSQRVDDAFDDAGAQRFADKYLDSVLESYQSAADGLRRTVILVAVLVLAFFLLEHAKSGAFEIGPLHLSNVAAVLTLIPAILSLQYIELAALATAGMRLEKLRDALFARLYPSIARESLDNLLRRASVYRLCVRAPFSRPQGEYCDRCDKPRLHRREHGEGGPAVVGRGPSDWLTVEVGVL